VTPEFSRPVNLARLPPEGRAERLAASPAECAALARRFAIPAVHRLEAAVDLRPEPGGLVIASGRLWAEVVQDCVVTLEPVTQQVEERVWLRILPPGHALSDDPEGPDEIEAAGDVVDLGEALAQQLALALDPYPRAPGAALPAEFSAQRAEGPFAALAALRKGR
jgi:uncharacterized metal-binding protein YceD (DUF177 family)